MIKEEIFKRYNFYQFKINIFKDNELFESIKRRFNYKEIEKKIGMILKSKIKKNS